MTVPEGKEIWIGNKLYKAGEELPVSYKMPEKKQVKQPELKKEK